MAENKLFVIATPIGNLGDITDRAKITLAEVDLICAEDTRHSGKLLNALGIQNRLLPLHDHNEQDKAGYVVEQLSSGLNVGLISDAGTPLISDPGYHLVNKVRAAGYDVVPIPGASALIAALSAAGLATDRFSFEGFLPAKTKARKEALEQLLQEQRTTVFYESTHRIKDCLGDIEQVLPNRQLVIARELTKTFETFLQGTAAELSAIMVEDENQTRGEFVLMVKGVDEVVSQEQQEIDRFLELLQEELPVKTAAAMAAKYFGGKKNEYYQRALELRQD